MDNINFNVKLTFGQSFFSHAIFCLDASHMKVISQIYRSLKKLLVAAIEIHCFDLIN